MSEIWTRIKQHQEEIKRQRERGFEPAKFNGSEEKRLRERRFYQHEKENNAIRIVTSVLEEIRANSKEIRQARFSNIFTSIGQKHYISVYLAWGNKHGKTVEEKRILEECQIDDKKQKQAVRLPVSFIGEDYYQIGTGVYEHMGDPLNSSLPPKYITSPERPISELAEQLMNPKHYFTRYVKGVDYLRPPVTWKPLPESLGGGH